MKHYTGSEWVALVRFSRVSVVKHLKTTMFLFLSELNYFIYLMYSCSCVARNASYNYSSFEKVLLQIGEFWLSKVRIIKEMFNTHWNVYKQRKSV